MFMLNIHITGKEGQLNLFFNDKTRAQLAYDRICASIDTGTSIIIVDDFHHQFCAFCASIACALFTDVSKEDELKATMHVLAKKCEQIIARKIATEVPQTVTYDNDAFQPGIAGYNKKPIING